MNISLNEVWKPNDFKKVVKVLGFASGMIDENTKDEEMLKAYKDVAHLCRYYLKQYEKKIKD